MPSGDPFSTSVGVVVAVVVVLVVPVVVVAVVVAVVMVELRCILAARRQCVAWTLLIWGGGERENSVVSA